jgi:ABC-type bacteriocin/lantibiotic exporter with double-glycine peptidase domain
MSACQAHWSARGQGIWSNTIIGISALAFGLFCYTVQAWLALILLILSVGFLTITWIRIPIWRKNYRESKKYTDNISITFEEDTLHTETVEGKSDLNWTFFSWHLETPDHVLLYTTKQHFSVIPKKAFLDKDSLQWFIDKVRQKVKRIK